MKKRRLWLLLLLWLAACTNRDIEVKVESVNVYHMPNEKTCVQIEEFVKKHSKLQQFYIQEATNKPNCTFYDFYLYYSLKNSYQGIELSEAGVDVFELIGNLNHKHQFTYIKEGILKNANLYVTQIIRYYANVLRSDLIELTLVAGGTTFKLQYDEEHKIFLNRDLNYYNEPIYFTPDLHEKLIRYYDETKPFLLSAEEVQKLNNDITWIIQQTADLTSNDIAGMKTINDITFDVIYPLMNVISLPTSHALIPNHYIVAKDGKYGLVNDNGLVVVDMNHDQSMFILDSKELLNYNEGIGNIPFTLYRYGGGHGINRREFYINQADNQVMAEYFGHDGPSLIYRYHKDAYVEDYPLLPYRSVRGYTDGEYGPVPIDVSKQYGLMTSDGRVITEPLFDEVSLTNTPLIAVRNGDFWGYINQQGIKIIDFQYQGILPYGDKLWPYPPISNYIIVRDTANKFGVLDLDGEVLVPFAYEWISPYFHDQIILKQDGKWLVKKP